MSPCSHVSASPSAALRVATAPAGRAPGGPAPSCPRAARSERPCPSRGSESGCSLVIVPPPDALIPARSLFAGFQHSDNLWFLLVSPLLKCGLFPLYHYLFLTFWCSSTSSQ